MADATRACAAGGLIIGPSGNVYDTGNGEDTRTDNIDYYTIQTTSNSTDFGDLTEHVGNASGTSDGTYGHVHGGSTEDAEPSSNPGGGAAELNIVIWFKDLLFRHLEMLRIGVV